MEIHHSIGAAAPHESPSDERRLQWENGFLRGILMASIEVGRCVPDYMGFFSVYVNRSPSLTGTRGLQRDYLLM